MKKLVLILIASIGINIYLSAQSAGDYRSVGNGNWNDPTKWETHNGSSWIAASTYPGQNSGTWLVTITNHTEIIITATVPNPVFALLVYAEYGCSCDNYSAPLGKLIFSAESTISLTVTTWFTVYGELLIDDQNGAKSHSIFIGGSLSLGVDGWFDVDYYYLQPTVFQTINQDDKINFTFNTTVPNSAIGGTDLIFAGVTFQDVTFSGIGIYLQSVLVKGHAIFSNVIVQSGYGGITFGDGATYSGASVASFVEGAVSKQGNDAFTFPIGGNGVYAPLTISAPVGETENFTAQYIRPSQAGFETISDPELYSVSNCEFWHLIRSSGNSMNYSLDVTVGWTPANGCGSLPYIENVSGVTLAHLDYDFNTSSNSLSWDSHSGSGVGTTENGSVTWYDVSNLGYFTFGNLNSTCLTPFGLSASNIITNSATLSWSSVSGSLSYDVDYKPAFASNWNWTNAATATTSTSVNLSGLNPLVTYDWRVRAHCSSSSSAYRMAQFTTLLNTCSSPSGLITTNITPGSATLNWNAVIEAVNYNVQYKPYVSASWITAVTGTTSLSYNLIGLSASTAYDWRVIADCSNYTQSSFTTAQAPICNDVYETNNTSSQAKTISLGSTISAGISSAHDIDWFKVTTPNNSNTNLEVRLSALPADYDLYVYNKNLVLVGSSTNTGNSNEVVIYNSNARKATYYVKVIGKNGAFNTSYCYSLLANVFGGGGRTASNASIPDNEVTGDTNKQLLYPNPASEFVYMNFNSATEGSVNIQIVNSIGQLVKQYPVNAINGYNQFKIQVADIRPGMYILRINMGDLNIIRKFVIER
jgi:hypothetical protein